MADYDFIAWVIAIIVAVAIVCGLGIPLAPATFEGTDHKGDSGMVIAGSGDQLAEATAPAGTEVEAEKANRWNITSETSETTEETSVVDGLTFKIVLEDGSTTAPLWVWVLCAACFVVIGGLAVGIWILVRKEFR